MKGTNSALLTENKKGHPVREMYELLAFGPDLLVAALRLQPPCGLRANALDCDCCAIAEPIKGTHSARLAENKKGHPILGMYELFWFSGLDLLVAAFHCNNPDGLRTSCSAMIASQSLNQRIKGTNSALLAENKKGHPLDDLFYF